MSFKEVAQKYSKNFHQTKIEFGPGNTKFDESYIGLDCIEKDSVDFKCDLNEGLEFIESATVDAVYSSHFLEHVENLGNFMKEIHRVLKTNGIFESKVPHFSNPYFYSDYTHSKYWGLYSISYFSTDSWFKRGVPSYYNDIDFKISSIQLNFDSPFFFRRIFKKGLGYLVNLNRYTQEFYEENLCWLCPCYEVYFKVIKK